MRSITTRTATTSTTHALNILFLVQLRLRHAADASGVEIRFFGLDAAEAAELLFNRGNKPVSLGSVDTQTIAFCVPGKIKVMGTYLLISLFLPFGDQVGVGIVVLEKPVVQLF